MVLLTKEQQQNEATIYTNTKSLPITARAIIPTVQSIIQFFSNIFSIVGFVMHSGIRSLARKSVLPSII